MSDDKIPKLPRRKGVKNNSILVAERRRIVFHMLLDGFQRRDILQYAIKQAKDKRHWRVSDKAIDLDIQVARKEMAAFCEIDKREEFGKARHRLENLYSKSIRDNDLKTALNVEKTRIDLLKLSDVVSDITEDKLDKFIELLMQKSKKYKSDETVSE